MKLEAIPRLLKLIAIKGSVVTIDAIGTQKEIAKHIIHPSADCVLALKENQSTLYHDVASIFSLAESNKQKQYKKMLHRRKIEKIKDHGRMETRKYTLLSARDPLLFLLRWPGLH